MFAYDLDTAQKAMAGVQGNAAMAERSIKDIEMASNSRNFSCRVLTDYSTLQKLTSLYPRNVL